MLKLIIGNEYATNPTVPLRWCLDRAGVEELHRLHVRAPYVLLIVRRGTKSSDRRYLFPLEDCMTYLPLHQAGQFQIYATVVWDSDGKLIDLKKRFIYRSWNRYTEEVVDDEGHLADALYDSMGFATVNLMVEPQLFPQEPPRWIKACANLWHDGAPVDQCQLRQRLLEFALLKWWLALIWYPTKMSIALIGAAFCFWAGRVHNLELKPIVMPWRYHPQHVWEYARFEDGWFNHAFRFLLLPVLWTGVGLLLSLFLIIGKGYGLGLVAIATAGLIVLLGFAVLAIVLTRQYQETPAARAASDARKRARDERRRRELADMYLRLNRGLTCEPNMVAAVTALPKERRTFVLRFLDLKQKVCRPYAQP